MVEMIMMHLFEIVWALKPIQNSFALQFRRLRRQAGVVRRPGIFRQMIHKTMMYRVIVDVNDHPPQIIFIIYRLPFERALKKVAVATVFFVQMFGISVEQMGKMLGGIGFFSFPFSGPNPVRSGGR